MRVLSSRRLPDPEFAKYFPMNPQKILVAVDFTGKGELTAPTQVAIQEALFWAQKWNASVRFVHFLEVSDRLWKRMQSGADTAVGGFYSAVESTLEKLVASTEEKGVSATYLLGRGKAWMELIRSVIDDGDEFVFAGTAAAAALARAIFGGTTQKLVRKCPVPVWVTKEKSTLTSGCVLAPHDLEETGEMVTRQAAQIATELGAPLKILHALHLPELDHFLGNILSTQLTQEKRRARATIEEHLKLAGYQGDYEIILEVGPPAPAINRFLRENEVRLLVMGSVGRSGIPGLIVGNTAETLLPWVGCSLLALKPEGFVSPVVGSE